MHVYFMVNLALSVCYLLSCIQTFLAHEVLATANGLGQLAGGDWLVVDPAANLVQPSPGGT